MLGSDMGGLILKATFLLYLIDYLRIGDYSLRRRHNLACTKLVTSAEQRRYP